MGVLKSRFVSMASHEFRTPLSAINFAAGFIKKYWTRLNEEERLKKLTKIEEQVKHMTNLLDDVLTMGKIDAGKLEFNPEEINFGEFISSIIEEVESGCNHTHKIKIHKQGLIDKIILDKKLGRNIFINLLSNAIKFSPNKNFVELKYSLNQEYARFEIKDYGIGIKPEDMEQIFEPFKRGANTQTIQGTGLGLAIVKEAVMKHKGFIDVKSVQGKGTSFIVNLPCKTSKN